MFNSTAVMISELLSGCLIFFVLIPGVLSQGPVVVTTWYTSDTVFGGATSVAWNVLINGPLTTKGDDTTRLDALEQGCNYCEINQCGYSVGYGSKPDETGEPTLDAMLMDGVTNMVGAVGQMRGVKKAISVARAVMDYTAHTLLVGESAQEFAVQMGFTNETLKTNYSDQQWTNWQANNCQPNFRRNVIPNASVSCGPYTPIPRSTTMFPKSTLELSTPDNHDTITMVVMDKNGRIASGGTTNGLAYKVHGRVGDTPVMGAGTYADDEIGGCGATGDGDVMMRFLPCYRTVLNMGQGMSPEDAAKEALNRIVYKQPGFNGAIIALNKRGEYGAATIGYSSFPFNVINTQLGRVTNYTVYPFKPWIPTTPVAASSTSKNEYQPATVVGVAVSMVFVGLLLGVALGCWIRRGKTGVNDFLLGGHTEKTEG